MTVNKVAEHDEGSLGVVVGVDGDGGGPWAHSGVLCPKVLKMVRMELNSVIMKCQALLKIVKMELNSGL